MGYYIDGTDAQNINRDLCDIVEHSGQDKQYTFFIDLTRSDKITPSLLGNVETVKNGFLSDGRYRYRRMWISPPTIFIFTNREPDWNGLSRDRWDKIFLNIKEDGLHMWEKIDGKPVDRVFQS